MDYTRHRLAGYTHRGEAKRPERLSPHIWLLFDPSILITAINLASHISPRIIKMTGQ